MGAGRASERLQAALGWPRLRARRLIQGAASLGVPSHLSFVGLARLCFHNEPLTPKKHYATHC